MAGGEPSVNWLTLTGALAYAREKGAEMGVFVVAQIGTNAVLNEKQVEWMIQNIDGASISLDGLPEVNDKHRITANGKGSSQYVIKTLKRFDEAGVSLWSAIDRHP